jgi:hypothetical protein
MRGAAKRPRVSSKNSKANRIETGERSKVQFLAACPRLTLSPYISTYDCIMIDLQSEPRFWQNEPNAGDF